MNGQGLFNRQIQGDHECLRVHLLELDARRQGNAVSCNGHLVAPGNRIGQVKLDLHLIGTNGFDQRSRAAQLKPDAAGRCSKNLHFRIPVHEFHGNLQGHQRFEAPGKTEPDARDAEQADQGDESQFYRLSFQSPLGADLAGMLAQHLAQFNVVFDMGDGFILEDHHLAALLGNHDNQGIGLLGQPHGGTMPGAEVRGQIASLGKGKDGGHLQDSIPLDNGGAVVHRCTVPEYGQQHLAGEFALPGNPALHHGFDAFFQRQDDQGTQLPAGQFVNALHEDVHRGLDLTLGNAPEKRFEVAGLQHPCNFVAKHDDDNQGGSGDDALHGPAGDDQAHVDRQPLQHPERGNRHDHPDDVGAPKQHVEPEQDIAVEQDINDILPAKPGEELYQQVHWALIRDAEAQGAHEVVISIGDLHAPGPLVGIPELYTGE